MKDIVNLKDDVEDAGGRMYKFFDVLHEKLGPEKIKDRRYKVRMWIIRKRLSESIKNKAENIKEK